MGIEDELCIWEDDKQIIMSMAEKKYLGWHEGDDGNVVSEYDDNQIEIVYREVDERGWAFGGDEYVSTADLENMAACIRNVLGKQNKHEEYTCQDDVFKMAIAYDEKTDSFSFSAALIKTLNWDYHITITKSGLSRSELDKYIQPFFCWERKYPVVR